MIDFIGKRKIWFSISALMIIICLASLLIQGINLGIDYTGGTLLDLKFDRKVTVPEVRKTLTAMELGDSKIQMTGDSGQAVLIRTKVLDEAQRAELLSSAEADLGKFTVMRIEKVSAVIGKELLMQAVWALLIASVLMAIYITWRFEYRFALTGIIGVLHDIIVVITFTSIFQIEVDSTYVAIILTVIGYSINDTIVVYDRIRENLKFLHRTDSLFEMVNLSINQTLWRCINTTGTTLVALFAIWVFGGVTIKGFVFGLFVGIAAGAYSSIFLCAPLWTVWKKRDGDNAAEKRRGALPVAKAKRA